MINHFSADRVFLFLFFYASCMTSVFSAVLDCSETAKNYEKIQIELKSDCVRTADCTIEDLTWSGCGKLTVHNDAEALEPLKKARSDLWSLCGFQKEKCQREISAAVCVHRKCQMQSDFDSLRGKKLKLLFLKDQRPLSNTAIILTADTGIRCAIAPCPSRREVKIFKTDSKGRVLWDFSEILALAFPTSQSKSQVPVQYVGPDGYAWEVKNTLFQAVDLQQFLIKTDKVLEVKF